MTGDKTTLKALLDHGKVDVNAANALGETALHLAALKKNAEVWAHYDAFFANEPDHTHAAQRRPERANCYQEEVRVSSASPHINRSTPLHYAVYQDDAACVEALLQFRTPPEMRVDSLGVRANHALLPSNRCHSSHHSTWDWLEEGRTFYRR